MNDSSRSSRKPRPRKSMNALVGGVLATVILSHVQVVVAVGHFAVIVQALRGSGPAGG